MCQFFSHSQPMAFVHMVVQSCLERVLLRAVLAGKAFHVSVFVHVSDVVVLVYYAQTNDMLVYPCNAASRVCSEWLRV